jgi:hypothetical protein
VVLLLHHREEVRLRFERVEENLDKWFKQVFVLEPEDARDDWSGHSDDQFDDSSFEPVGLMISHPSEVNPARTVVQKGRDAVATDPWMHQKKEVRFAATPTSESCCFPQASSGTVPSLLESFKAKIGYGRGVDSQGRCAPRATPDSSLEVTGDGRGGCAPRAPSEPSLEVVASESSRQSKRGSSFKGFPLTRDGRADSRASGSERPSPITPTEDMDFEFAHRDRTRKPNCVQNHDTVLGTLWGIYGAIDAQNAALSLLNAAKDGDELYFWGYTLDRQDIVDELIDAHCKRRVIVKVLVDRKMLYTGTTKEMFQQVARLSSSGCLVRLATGVSLSEEYNRAGRSVSRGLEGVSHAKAILSGTWFLCGSTNWTTSSRCNVERSTLTELTEHASRIQYQRAQSDWDNAEEFTEDLRRDLESRGSGDQARSRSEPASRSTRA